MRQKLTKNRTGWTVRWAGFFAMLLLAAAMSLPVSADVSQAAVKAVQQKLSAVGIDCGTPDGVPGSRTQAAVRQWREAMGDASTDGTIDDGLLRGIGISADGAGIGSSGILPSIPPYAGEPYVTLNDNNPGLSDADDTTDAFENYSDLDALGRCGVAYANICQELMPTEERGRIGSVKPTGWHLVKYDNVDGKFLYNRCHLIGYQLSGENANEKNLITGTRYMNVEGMEPFENMVADYVKETGNHVLYRVTPLFDGDNLLASGVEMEARSVEDQGAGILFHVFCYNVQPGIAIDYRTGASFSAGNTTADGAGTANDAAAGTAVDGAVAGGAAAVMEPAPTQTPAVTSEPPQEEGRSVWISATGSKYHSRPDCGRMNPDNARQISEADAVAQGYGKCSKCW